MSHSARALRDTPYLQPSAPPARRRASRSSKQRSERTPPAAPWPAVGRPCEHTCVGPISVSRSVIALLEVRSRIGFRDPTCVVPPRPSTVLEEANSETCSSLPHFGPEDGEPVAYPAPVSNRQDKRQQQPRLDPADWLTHYGRTTSGFKSAPSSNGEEKGLSLIAGRLTPEMATELVCRREADEKDVVRHTLVSRLLEAGFVVKRTPIDPTNPDHVSVEYPGDWDDTVCERFDKCFD